MKRYVTKGKLKNQIGVKGPHPVLYCRFCDSEYSANVGDYFMLPDSHVFKCCDAPLILAKVVTRRSFVRVEEG